MFSARPPVAAASSFAAVCDRANPSTLPPFACHAFDTTRIVVVLPVPAGPTITFTAPVEPSTPRTTAA